MLVTSRKKLIREVKRRRRPLFQKVHVAVELHKVQAGKANLL